MRRDDRPMRPEEEFAAWLDALVLGQETAPHHAGDDWAELGAIEAMARHAWRLETHSGLSGAERRRIKEEIMATTNQSTDRFTLRRLPPPDGGDAEPLTMRPGLLARPHASMRGRLTSIMSGALVAVLLATIVAGFGIHNGWGSWGDDGQPTKMAAPAVAANAPTLPKPENCRAKPLTEAELQKIITAPYEQRTYQLAKKQTPVDVVDGAAILQTYEQIRDCSVFTVDPNPGPSLLSPHAIQEMYWRATSIMGIFDTHATGPGAATSATPQMGSLCATYQCGTPPVSNSAFVWQPDISKTDTYFAQINVATMDTMKDGRVVAWIHWINLEGQPPRPDALPPLTGLIFIKIDGQWKLDDWLFGTQILTDAGR